MKNKDQIIALIQHDLKSHEIADLQKVHNRIEEGERIELLDLVFELMNVPPSAELDWGKTYCNYMNFAPYYFEESTSEKFKKQAELCFSHLQCIIDVEMESRAVQN